MFDDGDRDRREIPNQRPGRLSIEQVVVGQLEPLPLPGLREPAALGRPIQRRRLVRILAVAEVAQFAAAQGEILR